MLQKGNSLRLAKESRKKQKQRLHQQEALMGQEGRDIDSRLARLFAVHEAHVAKTERNQHSRLKSVTDRLDVLERSQRRVEEQQRLMSEQVAKMMRLVEHTARMTALVLFVVNPLHCPFGLALELLSPKDRLSKFLLQRYWRV